MAPALYVDLMFRSTLQGATHLWIVSISKLVSKNSIPVLPAIFLQCCGLNYERGGVSALPQ
jgi:hypothetical protein